MTDINLKQMLFEQRMKEIEDNIVPFGFIDDGQGFAEVLTQQDRKDNWQVKEFDPDLRTDDGFFDRDL